MRGNHFGKIFSFVSFGESHGSHMGVVIDGMPSMINIDETALYHELKKRAPGQFSFTSSRQEEDSFEILSGVFNGQTLGTPIAVIIKNRDQKSQDYNQLKHTNRPGHADQTTIDKFGIRDYRGSGRASGRETVARVIAGYFAGLILPQVQCQAYASQIGKFSADVNLLSQANLQIGATGFLDIQQETQVQHYLEELKNLGNSCGGKIVVKIQNVPAGLGEPCFDKLKADLAKAMLSIGACTGFHYGLGEAFASKLGQEISTDSQNFGGIEGGISNGEDIHFELTFKATSTLGEHAKNGRHDPCILPRVIPVVTSMAKIVIADHFLRQNAYNIKSK